MILETKRCPKCKETKSNDKFHFDNAAKDRLACWCKDCNRKSTRQTSWRYRLWHEYGMTEIDYELMLKSQSEKCAICEQFETKIRSDKLLPLSVDHCHKTFKIRGLLCDDCNIILGKAKDNPEILRRAAEYLEKHR